MNQLGAFVDSKSRVIKLFLALGLILAIVVLPQVVFAEPVVRCGDDNHELYGGISSDAPELLSVACADLDNDESLEQSNVILTEASHASAFDMGVTCEDGGAPISEIERVEGFDVLRITCVDSRVDRYSFASDSESELGDREPVSIDSAAAAAQQNQSQSDSAEQGELVPEFVGACDFNGNGLIDRAEGSEQGGQSEYECAFPTVGGPFVALPLNPDGTCPDGYLKTTIALFEDDNGRPLNCVPKDGGSVDRNPIVLTLRAAIRFLTAGVAIAVAAMIVAGGLTYIASRGNPQLAQKAKVRIFNAVVAFVVYVLAVVIINFLIPGGLL